MVFEARCAGEDVLLHEELATGKKAEGIDRVERHGASVHPLRCPDTELRPSCGVREVAVAAGELPVPLGCPRCPDVHPASRVQGQDAEGLRVLRRGLGHL